MKSHKKLITVLLTGLLILSGFSIHAYAATWPGWDLTYGMTGEDVAVLQSTLASQGYWVGDIDGYFGDVTYNALCQYQTDHGLYVDGVAGKITYNSLYGPQTSNQTASTGSSQNSSRSMYLGMTGDDVYQLQKRLQEIGYWVGGADGYFGAYTEAAVIQYQTDHGLYVDGVVGAYTLAALYGSQSSVKNAEIYENSISRTLTKGMTGADVVALQSMLTQMGYSVGGIDGDFGSYTEAAVKAFQRDHGNLYVDGIVGAQTRKVIDSELSGWSSQKTFSINDTLLVTGSSYIVNPYFADGKGHNVTLSSSSSVISISGMTIKAVAEGTAEVKAECEGDSITFIVAVRNQSYIDAEFGNINNANDIDAGLEQRLQGLEDYSGNTDTMVLFAGDSYLDERLYLTDFDSRFAGGNVYSSAISGSTAHQWANNMSEFYEYQPSSLVMNLGINDLRRGETAVAVVNNLKSLFGSITQNMPNTTIYWWNIAPHIGAGEEYYKIAAVNSAIQKYSQQNKNLVVVDSYGAMTNSNGLANTSLYRDTLHPNTAGYDQLFQKTYQAGLQVPKSGK